SRKASVGVRERDEHEAAARPDVQGVWIQRRPALHGGDGQLLVVVIEELLVHGDVRAEREARAHGRSCAVGRDCRNQRDLVFGLLDSTTKTQDVARRVRSQAALPEAQGHRGRSSSGLDEQPVERAPADGIDDLIVSLPVGMKRCAAIPVVDHSSAHGDQKGTNRIHQTRTLKRANATSGQCKIDGASALRLRAPRVRAALEQAYRESALGQHDREKRSGEAGADDVDWLIGLRFQAWISPSARCSSSANVKTSVKVLYRGTGAARITLGSRQSHTTPRSRSVSNTRLPRVGVPAMRSESWQPRAAASRGLMILTRGSSCSSSNSRNPVSARDFSRSRSNPASRNIFSEASSGAAERMGGLLTAQPAAPPAARNPGSIWNRVVSSCPHQPESRGVRCEWRSWMKQPPIAPGPPLRYL